MTFLYFILLFIVLFLVITNLPVFGKLPSGSRRAAIRALPNYKDGAIQNLSATPMQPEGISMFSILLAFFFKKHLNRIPSKPIDTVQADLSASLAVGNPEITWFGHSSYLIKTDQYKMLVDPVFSKTPSPFSFIGSKAFEGTDVFRAEDFPELDVLLITHDHYDHLDYQTILKLASRTKHFITSLGVGAHLENWGIKPEKITELSWYQSIELLPGLKFTAVPARHFTGRKFKRNQTLWSAFVMETDRHKLFLGGDSGYDTHFKEIGTAYGPFDLALLECGQYNEYWPYIHMFPEQTVQAAKDLNAKVLMPVHWGKFSLAMHAWNEPVIRIRKAAEDNQVQLTIPKFGEKIILDQHYPVSNWYE